MFKILYSYSLSIAAIEYSCPSVCVCVCVRACVCGGGCLGVCVSVCLSVCTITKKSNGQPT